MILPEYKDAEKVFYFFEEISKIPHASENTGPIADWLVAFAKERGLWYYRDGKNNVIIRKPATAGYEKRPTVIFQGHTDMVADKVAGCNIDMSREGLQIYRDGDFIRAEGTTLGGDDGVALAYALAVLDSSDIEHPEFEALFTSDEEIGLLGATALDASVLHGKILVNIDSDEEGVFTVGCAGGLRVDMTVNGKLMADEATKYRLGVSGLIGGHSGTEIDKGRENAIKILAEILSATSDVRIVTISGGNADNAIPRYAECVFSSNKADSLFGKIEEAKAKYGVRESGIEILLEAAGVSGASFDADTSRKVLEIISKTPRGGYQMSEEISGLPETSSNLGVVVTDGGRVTISTSVRSSKNSEKSKLVAIIREISDSYGAGFGTRGEYPAWEYKADSYLRELMKKTYTDLYGKEPKVIIIHAGLECGIFADKIEGLDCVSIGPDNFDIHTPSERLSISSTARVWEYLKELLKRI